MVTGINQAQSHNITENRMSENSVPNVKAAKINESPATDVPVFQGVIFAITNACLPICLPNGETNNEYDIPKRPAVVFLHGSGGLSDTAKEFAKNLAVASKFHVICPDDHAFPDSIPQPIDVAPLERHERPRYEATHVNRSERLEKTLTYVQNLPFVEQDKLFLFGNSGGAVIASRHSGEGFAGVATVGWSYEKNYYVKEPKMNIADDKPLLAMIAKKDRFFSTQGLAQKVADKENMMVTGEELTALKGRPNTTIFHPTDTDHSAYVSKQVIQKFISFVGKVLK